MFNVDFCVFYSIRNYLKWMRLKLNMVLLYNIRCELYKFVIKRAFFEKNRKK